MKVSIYIIKIWMCLYIQCYSMVTLRPIHTELSDDNKDCNTSFLRHNTTKQVLIQHVQFMKTSSDR